MTDQSAFDKRGASFEAEYFSRKDAETIRKLKSVFQKKMDAEALAQATGVSDPKIVERMLELNLKGELMAAFQIYPVIEVAWADGHLDDKEAAAVIAAAEKRGIAKDSNAHLYLEERLKSGPSRDLRTIWRTYAGELKKTLSPAELEAFRKDVLDLCRSVAEASGGVMGKLFTVGTEEKKALADIESALTP